MEIKKYELPKLPYAYNALEPYISEEIMMLHHDKHHVAYVNNLNDALEKFPDLQEKTAEELLVNLSSLPEEIRTAVKNNGGGHVNHSMFWEIMKENGGGEPTGALAEEIAKQFGSFADFQTKFNEAGAKRFGSGWVWLAKNPLTGSGPAKLGIVATANQDNP